jgi:hypothetical protein
MATKTFGKNCFMGWFKLVPTTKGKRTVWKAAEDTCKPTYEESMSILQQKVGQNWERYSLVVRPVKESPNNGTLVDLSVNEMEQLIAVHNI